MSQSGSGQAAAVSPRTFGTFPRESWSFSSSTSFTVKQGQYLAFIDHYSRLHGVPPAESDFRAFFKVTPPVVHQMIKTLHARGFIDRAAGKARSITLRLSRAHLPDLEPPGLGEPLLNSGAGMTAKRARGTSASRREERGIHSRSHEKGASRCSPRETRQESDCLDVLTGEEAGAVLRALLKAHPDLLPDARLAADKLLATVSFSDVAERVCAGLRALDLDDLDAGAHGSGYVEPSEAAWSAIEGVVAPSINDLERRVKLRHEDEAFQVCSGIVAGLYRAEQSGFGLYEYAEDAPSELAGHAVDIWRGRRRNCAFPRDFVETFTPTGTGSRTDGETPARHRGDFSGAGLRGFALDLCGASDWFTDGSRSQRVALFLPFLSDKREQGAARAGTRRR